jgi:hypothetical protein
MKLTRLSPIFEAANGLRFRVHPLGRTSPFAIRQAS